MAGTFLFNLVSPERRLASLEATEVQIPGAEGDMTAMQGHAPTITSLRPGILRAVSPEGTQSFAVIGGFAEIASGSVAVLAEHAMPLADVTAEAMDTMIADAQARAEVTGTDRAVADKFVADMIVLKAAALA